MLRWITAALVLVGVVGGATFLNLQGAVTVDAAVVETGVIRTYVEEQAKTRLAHVYRITMPLAGRVEPITLEEGDAVAAEQVVARMDPADLETELAEATASVNQFAELLRSVDSAIQAAKEQLVASQAKAAFAEREFKRISSLAETAVVSETQRHAAELLQVESKVDHTQDVLTLRAAESIRQAFVLAQQEAEETQKRRRRDRDRADIHSPVAGLVLRRHVSSERVLPAGELLLEIGRLDDLEVEAEILTQEAVEIDVDDPVEIEGPAVGAEPIRGRVKRIEPQGFTKISSLGVEQQRVRVIVAFDADSLAAYQETGRRLGVDYRVRVKIFTAEKQGVLTIPRSALFRSAAGGWQAFVIRDGRARLVDLAVGLSNDYEMEVLDGVRAGEAVILAPESGLTDGQRVEAAATASG